MGKPIVKWVNLCYYKYIKKRYTKASKHYAVSIRHKVLHNAVSISLK